MISNLLKVVLSSDSFFSCERFFVSVYATVRENYCTICALLIRLQRVSLSYKYVFKIIDLINWLIGCLAYFTKQCKDIMRCDKLCNDKN